MTRIVGIGVELEPDLPAGLPAIGSEAVWATGPEGIYRIDPEDDTVAAVIQAGD